VLLDDLELAFEFVSSAPPLTNTAYVSRSTGKIYSRSEYGDVDDLPEGLDEDGDYLEIPHRNDLDLGQRLVWEFVEQEIPEHLDRVRGLFRRRGAYDRFKDFLGEHRLREAWHTFEAARTRQALREWAAAVGLAIDGLSARDAPADLRIWQDDRFTVEHSHECGVPGYVVLRLTAPVRSLAELDPELSRSLGEALTRTAQAIEQVTGPERVYCLSFCEVDRRLHFHLFPRTRALLEAYRAGTGAGTGPPNGPTLFEWARTTLPAGTSPPPGLPSVEVACARLRALLGGA